MPEYSTPKLTPAETTKLTGMNSGSSGYFEVKDVLDIIRNTYGQNNGVATLGSDGKLPSSQLPDLADDVIVVDSYSTLPAIGTAGKLYITADNNKMYRWDPELTTPDYVELSIDLSEYARIVDIQDGNIQAGVAVKAFQDAMGRAIITTYETKADASDLKDAIDNNSQRIENLEVAVSGSLVQTNILTDPPSMANVRTITNANEILPWAILKRVGARAVAWNQFWKLRETTYYNCSEPDADGYQKISLKNTTIYHARCGINGNNPLPLNHKVLAVMQSKTSGALTGTKWFIQNSDDTEQYSQITADNNTVITTTAYARSVITVNWEPYFTSNPTAEIEVRVQVFDLTANGFNDLYDTDSLRKTNFLRQFPSSVYYPVNLGEIIPLNPSAFKVVGKNKWDEEWETGLIDIDTGANYNTNAGIRSKNYIPISSINYAIIYTISSWCRKCFYDADKNFISGVQNSSALIEPPASACYMRFSTDGNYGTTYNHDIMICLNSVTDKTYEEYKETTIDTSFTEDYLYVNENCYDYSENVLVNGVMRRKEHKGIVGSYTFTGTENLEYTTQRWRIQISGIKRVATGADVGNLLLATYLTTSTSVLSSDKTQRYVAVDNSSDYVYLVNPNALNSGDLATMQADLAGKTLFFELASPSTPTLHDPIPNITCEDGTTITAVTPQTDLVNAIDVPSTIAYMTKIGG